MVLLLLGLAEVVHPLEKLLSQHLSQKEISIALINFYKEQGEEILWHKFSSSHSWNNLDRVLPLAFERAPASH
jgi:hypothetical protein